ncbi:phospholipid carrier-dependent glycosyltransferase [Salsipaludibacter albus]|uniref:phospholipid carrier-dependent glycosyltransferase n=1 Tax=Salsipaludibacter albus TaxID=2849650 RepID=UPI001EE4439D|nr:phospholipid carrier-dependent glycosyltransferase [Salsipaludibacter albus]MBY5161951.1 glycosyltransferase family 39 protein [Salsipaludibacter albus]
MNWLTASPRRLRILLPLGIVLLAVGTMLVGVGHPDRIFFDEVYYVNDARDFLEFGVEQGFVVHPPLGKLLIASGIHVFGDDPFGWRVVGAVLGVASVWLVWLIARRLGLRLAAAALAGIALALDGVFVAQARTSMLDIHLGFFVLLGTWALVMDLTRVRRADDAVLAADERSRTRVQAPPGSWAAEQEAAAAVAAGEPTDLGPVPSATPRGELQLPRVSRWWLLLAGAAFGAAIAVKWSGALAMLAAGLVWLGMELARRRRVTGRFTRHLPRALGLGVIALAVVPAVVYALSWTPWFVAFDDTYEASSHCAPNGDELDCDGVVGRGRALVDYHERMIGFHLDLEAEHAYRAAAWNWPIQRRPVVFYYETCSQDRLDRVEKTNDDGEVEVPEPCRVAPGQAAEIFDLGNVATWWLLLAGLPILGLLLRRRDPAAWVVAVFYAVQFLPWLVVARPVFNFYTVPLVPFVVLGLALAVDRISSRDAWLSAMAAGAVAAGAVLLGSYGLELLDVGITEVGRWYAVGVGALVGGALSPQLPGVATGPDLDRPRRRWPTLSVVALVVAVGLFFLPLWTGVSAPSWFIKSHWWLSTWI